MEPWQSSKPALLESVRTTHRYKPWDWDIGTIKEAEQISRAAYDRLTVEEKAVNYWEASQDLYKNERKVS